MPQTLIKDSGGTVETYFRTGRPATCTVSVYNSEAAVKVDAASATVDTVSTTISSAVAARASTVALASASGVVSGGRYCLGSTASTAPLEVVTVKSVDASTATLFQPTLYAHNSGDTFKGTRVYYTVTSGDADALWFDGYAVFTPSSGDAQTEVVDCVVRKIPPLLEASYLLEIFPAGAKYLSANLDLPAAMDRASDRFLRRLGGRVRAHTQLGADDFKHGAALTFWLERLFEAGDTWQDTRKDMQTALEAEVTQLRASVPVDAEQDGVTDGPFDGHYTSGKVSRA